MWIERVQVEVVRGSERAKKEVEKLFLFFIRPHSSPFVIRQVIGCPSNLLRQMGWTTNDLLLVA